MSKEKDLESLGMENYSDAEAEGADEDYAEADEAAEGDYAEAGDYDEVAEGDAEVADGDAEDYAEGEADDGETDAEADGDAVDEAGDAAEGEGEAEGDADAASSSTVDLDNVIINTNETVPNNKPDTSDFMVLSDNKDKPSTTNLKISSNKNRITRPILTKFEYVRCLSIRAEQISLGAKIMLENADEISKNKTPKEIANLEIMNNCCPLIIIRNLPNRIERWSVNELKKIWFSE